MKAPFIFMNEESEYFYIFPNVFFSKSKGAFLQTKKNRLWPFYLKWYFVKNYHTFFLMDYGFAPCECFDKKRISKEGVQIQIRRMQEELDIICRRKDKCCLNRLPLNYLTPEKLFKFIDYTMSHEN